MRSPGFYDSGRKNHGGEVLVVAVPRAKAAAGTSKSTSLRRPKAYYRLLWEIYKSNRE